MNNGVPCVILSMNLLNWGMYGAVAEPKVRQVCGLIADNRPRLLCLSEVGPNDALEQLTRPLAALGLDYHAVSVGTPNSRGIRNAVLALRDVEVLDPNLRVPLELTLPAIQLENFEMGPLRLKLSRQPIAVLVRIPTSDNPAGTVLAVGFFHPKSKFPEDYKTGNYPTDVPDQTYLGVCKMISSLRNFGQCLLAREFVDRFWTHNALKSEWRIAESDVRFVLVGDWNANPQEEQRHALRGYLEGGLSPQSLLMDSIGTASTDMKDICTIAWDGVPNSFDAIYIDRRLEGKAETRILHVEAADLFGYPDAEREHLENEVLDHRPVGLYLKSPVATVTPAGAPASEATANEGATIAVADAGFSASGRKDNQIK